MVTYADLFQFCILLVTLTGLCYAVFKGKKQPPLPDIATAARKG